MSFFEKRFKKRFFSSIRTKFVIVYVLVNIISLQLIGLFFTTQLRNSNINTFEQNIIEQEKILNYHVREELEKASGSGEDTSKALDDTGTQEESTKSNKDSKSGIAKLVSEFNIQKLLLVNVIDKDSKIIATSSKNGNDEYLAKRSFDPLVSQVIKTGESTKQIQNNADSNKRVWIYVSPVKKDNEVIGKRIEEEQAVTETERRKLATIIESMMDGIITTDNNGKIILINTSAEDMLGGRDDEIFIGKDVLKILNITEYESIEEILEAEDSLLVNTSKTDEELLLRAEISKIEKEDKEDLTQMSTELEGYIIVLYDVTDQERQEKERREFVSTVSHELRTPLTTMNSYIEALEEGVLEDKELAPQFIDTIHKETTRMIRMVNELMQLGKMDIKEEHYEKEFIDINKMLEQITDRFALTHPEKNFIKHIPKSPIFVEGDQDKLTQVFDNIVNNAIKYSPNGKNITVRVRQNYHHNRVSISIKDEGVGIPLVHIDKIFNRFYRVDKSRQRSMGGTGLGLALAKTIVEAHKGRIWAQSREGYGSIIFVTLPCEQIDDEWL